MILQIVINKYCYYTCIRINHLLLTFVDLRDENIILASIWMFLAMEEKFHGVAQCLIQRAIMYLVVKMNVTITVPYLIAQLVFTGLPQQGHATWY